MTTTRALPASPKKLRDGTWGAITDQSAEVGSILQITTRAGKTWQARVGAVLWRGDGKAICTTDNGPPRSSDDSRPVRGVDYCGYPCPVTGIRCTPSRPCHDCE